MMKFFILPFLILFDFVTPYQINFYDKTWFKKSWQHFPVRHLPEYESKTELLEIQSILEKKPPLIFVEEADKLQQELIETSKGNAFVVIAGNCVETFDDFRVEDMKDFSKLMFQIGLRISKETGKKAVKIGRIAGQYAKPRSSPFEDDEKKIPSYRGDIIHSWDKNNRTPDPKRLLDAYHHSVSSLNLLRAFSKGGLASLDRVQQWKIDSISSEIQDIFLKDIESHLKLLRGLSLNPSKSFILQETNLYIAHECLHLPYEESLTRFDSTSFRPFSCSSHFLWIGERTRQYDEAHIEFIRGIHNPIGIKVSSEYEKDELLKTIQKINPYNFMGRVTIMTRFGADKINQLPKLIQLIQDHRLNVVWICDPMHGNTKEKDGFKVRYIDDIQYEIQHFFQMHYILGTIPGGIHLEATPSNVSEVLESKRDFVIPDKYTTKCDPRLNGTQILSVLEYTMSLINH